MISKEDTRQAAERQSTHKGESASANDGAADKAGAATSLTMSTTLEIPQERPNVIFVLLDDLDYFDLPTYDPTTEILTPHLDCFAFKAMKMTEFYMSSVCYTTRTMLMSGRNPLEFGIMNPAEATSYRSISADAEQLAERLRKNGYYTGHIGKWHIGYLHEEHLPLANGFTISVIPDVTFPLDYYTNRVFINNESPPINHDGEHFTEVVTNYALDFIRDNRDHPFFLNLWYNAPHRPPEPPPHWASQYPDDERGGFAGLVSHADEQLGRIFDELDILGITHNTLVIVTSDNGGTGVNHQTPKPLRGGKGTHFERGIKVPFFVRFPGKVPGNTSNASVGVGYDMFTTLADILDIDVSDLTELRGKSLKNVWYNNIHEARADKMFWENKYSDIHFVSPSGYMNKFAVRDGDYKLILDDLESASSPSLFDIAQDPGETTDIAAANPAIAQGLLESYHNWRRSDGEVDYEVSYILGDDTVYDGSQSFTFGSPGIAIFEKKTDFDFHDGDFSIEVTINKTSGVNCVITRSLESLAYVLKVMSDGHLLFYLNDGGAGQVNLVSQDPIEDGQDYHIVASVFAYRGAEQVARLYIDDVLQAESASDVLSVMHSDATICVGNSMRLKQPFLGEIKDLKYYNIALLDNDL